MCGRNAATFKPTYFDIAWLEKTQSVLDKIEEVTLMGWGEPTIHPEFNHFLDWAHANGLRKYFCTNGMRLDRLVDVIFDTETDIIAISLDGANAETNNRIRRGADFNKVIKNIKLVTSRRETWPYMNFVFTAMKSNISQLPDIVRLASDIGLQEVKVVYLTAFNEDMADETLYGNNELILNYFQEAKMLADSYGVFLKLPHLQGDDSAKDDFHKTCYTGWRDFFLGSDGYIRPCMSSSDKLFHISKYKTFGEIWNSSEYETHRRKVNNPDMSNACKMCYQSSFANWNRKESFLQLSEEFSPNWG
jgi:radical SAM protein with 4Fe4S-binding SPASM domain